MKYDSVPSTETNEFPEHHSSDSHCRSNRVIVGGFLLIISLLLGNVGWIWVLSSGMSNNVPSYPPYDNVHVPFYQDTAFGRKAESRVQSDELWKGLFPSGNGEVSVAKTEATAYQLSSTITDPDAADNGIYVVSGFHNLHCLVILRASLYHYYEQEEQTAPWPHVVHCLDQIRQTMMCNFDTTLIPMIADDEFKDAEQHVCKNYSEIFDWTTKHRPQQAPGDPERVVD